MPYRRLPNTDSARIKALKAAIEKSRAAIKQDVISVDIKKLENILRNFESAYIRYKDSLEAQATANKKFQKLVKNARLYISHFIQVYNLSIIRNEIKKETKPLYNIDPENFTVPDLSANDSIIKWGENIIKGEQSRISHGGTPIYNPTIARVNVAYSLFKEAYFAQKTYQNTTNRHLESLSEQRQDVDDILTILWNQIEDAFARFPQEERLERCKEYGVVYYLRKNEKEEIVNENY